MTGFPHRHAPSLGSRDVSPRAMAEARTAPGVKACHKQDVFIERIERALGVSIGEVHCHLVEPSAMGSIMSRHGWNKDDARGVVGFQVKNDIYVLTVTPWTVLHELVHRAGVNADRMSRFVAEGLTECIAADLKQSPDEHKPTYPEEVGWVRGTLLPTLGLTSIQLGRILAKSSDPPRTLVDMILEKAPETDRAKLLDELRPQQAGRPSFNVDAVTSNGWALGVGTAFITAGALLIFSAGGSRV